MSVRWFILNENDEAISITDVHRVLAWERVNGSRRLVAYDRVNGADVSTVLLASAQLASALPFETRIFGGPHDDFFHRWANHAAARTGHHSIVSALIAGRNPGEST